MRKSVRAVMALRKQIVNGRFSFRDRARWRGKFIYPPRLAKWLGKMRFLAGSRNNKVVEALL